MLFTITLAPAASSSEPNKSIVIVDTGVDMSIPAVANAVTHEVCLAVSGCTTTEGPGAANMPAKNGFEHGTLMTLVADQVNPNTDIIFIRVWRERAGRLMTMSSTEFNNVMTASLDWVIANKTKFNIVSVSASMGGSTGYRPGVNYCPVTASHAKMISNINTLSSMGVATIFAAGNDRDINRINFPACIDSSIAVSGVNTAQYRNDILTEANVAPQVDFFALGVYNTSVKAVRGTSASAAAFSAYWAKNYKGSFVSTYDYMKSITKPVKNSRVSSTLFVDVLN